MKKKKDSCFGKKEYPDDVIKGASLLYYLKYSQDPINIHQEHETLIKKPKTLIKKPACNNGEPEYYSSDERKAVYALLSLKYSTDSSINEDVIQKQQKRRKIIQEDDTEETLQVLLQQLNNGESEIPPPDQIVSCIPNLAQTQFSKCIYKQLTESDVNGGQSRLMLGKKEVKDKFLCLLEESEIPGVEGIDVLVYGPDGKVHEMKFKIRIKNRPVLTNGWIKFVETYELQKYSNVLKIWMFRASQDRKICFVIDSIRFDGITKQLSKRILKSVFKS